MLLLSCPQCYYSPSSQCSASSAPARTDSRCPQTHMADKNHSCTSTCSERTLMHLLMHIQGSQHAVKEHSCTSNYPRKKTFTRLKRLLNLSHHIGSVTILSSELKEQVVQQPQHALMQRKTLMQRIAQKHATSRLALMCDFSKTCTLTICIHA